MPQLLDEVNALAAENGASIFQVPPYFAYIAKAFSVLEGIGLGIDPNYSNPNPYPNPNPNPNPNPDPNPDPNPNQVFHPKYGAKPWWTAKHPEDKDAELLEGAKVRVGVGVSIRVRVTVS